MSRKREQLLGYLLGALDDAERAQVERELAQQPALQAELDELRRLLEPLEEGREEYEPPADLAARTCAAVPDLVPPTAEPHELQSPAPAARSPRAVSETVASWHSASLLDLVVAAGVCLALSLLFFPALLSSREVARRLTCQENLRLLGQALASYSNHHQSIPAIPDQGNGAFAGFYAVQLHDSEMFCEAGSLLCPGGNFPLGPQDFRVPSITEIMAASGPRLDHLQRTAGGTYGYNIGYWDGARYRTPQMHRARKAGEVHALVMSDAPDAGRPAALSDSHGGHGMNALFSDMRIVFIRGCTIPSSHSGPLDHVFLNREGRIAIGLDDRDSVIGRSETPPRPLGPRVAGSR